MQQTVVELAQVSGVLKLLGDKTRLTTIAILNERKCCVCELQVVFDMSQPSISQHLRKLKDIGLLKEERQGQWIYYSLNEESSFIQLLKIFCSMYLIRKKTFNKLKSVIQPFDVNVSVTIGKGSEKNEQHGEKATVIFR